MSAWVWVAIVGVAWLAGIAIAVGLARSAALGDRIETVEPDPGARDEEAAGEGGRVIREPRHEPRHVVGRR